MAKSNKKHTTTPRFDHSQFQSARQENDAEGAIIASYGMTDDQAKQFRSLVAKCDKYSNKPNSQEYQDAQNATCAFLDSLNTSDDDDPNAAISDEVEDTDEVFAE